MERRIFISKVLGLEKELGVKRQIEGGRGNILGRGGNEESGVCAHVCMHNGIQDWIAKWDQIVRMSGRTNRYHEVHQKLLYGPFMVPDRWVTLVVV